MKSFRVKILVDTYYDVEAENEEMAIDKAYGYMIHDCRLEVEEIDEED